MSRRARRGQALVLLALSVLVVCVLVLVTLSVGSRIHERQQLQAAADAAAYSEAVVVARTYNSVAVMNRAIIAQMAAISAVEATISFTAAYHGLLNNARDTLQDKAAATAGMPECSAAINQAVARIVEEDERFISAFEKLNPNSAQVGSDGRRRGLDIQAGELTRRLHGTALEMSDDQFTVYRVLRGTLDDVAREVATKARAGSRWDDDERELRAGNKQPVTRYETRHADEQPGDKGAGPVPGQSQPREMVQAVMAARSVNDFTVSRDRSPRTGLSGKEYFVRRLAGLIRPMRLGATNLSGTAYYEDDRSVGRHSGFAERVAYGDPKANLDDWNRWRKPNRLRGEGPLVIQAGYGQDFGVFKFHFGPEFPARCRSVSSRKRPGIQDDYYGYLRETARADDTDFHVWRRGDYLEGPFDYTEWHDFARPSPPYSYDRHGLKNVPRDGPLRVPPRLSIWPIFVDYDSERLAGGRTPRGTSPEQDLWGQPKVQVLMRRDYAVREAKPDPWELSFRFSVTRGSQTELDIGASSGGRHSLAVASGLAYYHRGETARSPDHVKEPPNLLNPFWRATLVASDVDEPFSRRGEDIQRTLDANDAPRDSVRLIGKLRNSRFTALP